MRPAIASKSRCGSSRGGIFVFAYLIIIGRVSGPPLRGGSAKRWGRDLALPPVNLEITASSPCIFSVKISKNSQSGPLCEGAPRSGGGETQPCRRSTLELQLPLSAFSTSKFQKPPKIPLQWTTISSKIVVRNPHANISLWVPFCCIRPERGERRCPPRGQDRFTERRISY